VGFVDDHRAALAGARVMLAPLAYGAGVKGKVGESLAVGTVVVTNHIGAEGMDAHGHALAVGQRPTDLAELAVRMHDDRHEWERRSAAGLAILRERFSITRHVDELLATIDVSRRKRDDSSFWALCRDYLWHQRSGPTADCDLQTAVRRLRWRNRADHRALESMRARVRRLMERDASLAQAVSASAVRRQGVRDR
jgi:hypothetical protein